MPYERSSIRRNVATELAALEQLADDRGVDLTLHRRREPVAHWRIDAERLVGIPDMTSPAPVATVTEVTFLNAISKMALELGKQPAPTPPPMVPSRDSRGGTVSRGDSGKAGAG